MELLNDATFAAAWGFRPVLRLQFESIALASPEGLVPARILAEHRGLYEVITPTGAVTAQVTGRFRHQTADRQALPAVGDWVALKPGAVGSVVAVLPRQTQLVRQAAGRRTEPQVLAANVDTVFVVTSANEDFSPRRIERYRFAIAAGGAETVVVLNKCDLVGPAQQAQLRDNLPKELTVVPMSALDGRGMDALEAWLQPGQTVALVGSSGVGKSTLVNQLHDAEVMATGAVRDSDATGQHTTTHRQLLRLPSGAMLIDTPGMREFQLWAEDDPASTDDPLADLAQACRFRDCSHQGEPGCAVQQALDQGDLSQEVLEGHDQLQRELAYHKRRQDVSAARREARVFAKHIKAHKKNRY